MPEQVDDELAGGAIDQAAKLRTDAGKRRHRREKQVQQGRAQLSSVRHSRSPHDATRARHYIDVRAAPNQTMTNLSDPRRKRLLFRSWHRGTREADLLLGSFAERHLAGFTPEQVDRYEVLLGAEDADLLG